MPPERKPWLRLGIRCLILCVHVSVCMYVCMFVSVRVRLSVCVRAWWLGRICFSHLLVLYGVGGKV